MRLTGSDPQREISGNKVFKERDSKYQEPYRASFLNGSSIGETGEVCFWGLYRHLRARLEPDYCGNDAYNRPDGLIIEYDLLDVNDCQKQYEVQQI